MVKHQPQLAAAAQKAAAMMSTSEAGTKPPHIGNSKVPSSDAAAAVNGETVAAESACDPTISDTADDSSAEVENQPCDQDLTGKELD